MNKYLPPTQPDPLPPPVLTLLLSLPGKLIQEEGEVGGAVILAEENLHDPKMPRRSSDSINHGDGENPSTPLFFVLKGDKLIPARLISRGTGRPPNFPKIYAETSGFIMEDMLQGFLETKSIHFFFWAAPVRFETWVGGTLVCGGNWGIDAWP